jgi:hypothetical protein
LGVLGFAVLSLFGILAQLKSAIPALWNLLFQSSTIQNWFLVLLFIFAIPTITRFALLFFREAPARFDPITYTSDMFNGILWTWGRATDDTPLHIAPHCPNCKTEILVRQARNPAIATFACDYEKCDNKLYTTLPNDYQSIILPRITAYIETETNKRATSANVKV